jgi:hypothetical protein
MNRYSLSSVWSIRDGIASSHTKEVMSKRGKSVKIVKKLKPLGHRKYELTLIKKKNGKIVKKRKKIIQIPTHRTSKLKKRKKL